MEESGGLFSGWNADEQRYNQESWACEPDENGGRESYTQDPTLQHPRCVYQVLKRHFSRYTPEMVERACGVPG